MTCVIADGGSIGLKAGRSVADGGCNFTLIVCEITEIRCSFSMLQNGNLLTTVSKPSLCYNSHDLTDSNRDQSDDVFLHLHEAVKHELALKYQQ